MTLVIPKEYNKTYKKIVQVKTFEGMGMLDEKINEWIELNSGYKILDIKTQSFYEFESDKFYTEAMVMYEKSVEVL